MTQSPADERFHLVSVIAHLACPVFHLQNTHSHTSDMCVLSPVLVLVFKDAVLLSSPSFMNVFMLLHYFLPALFELINSCLDSAGIQPQQLLVGISLVSD